MCSCPWQQARRGICSIFVLILPRESRKDGDAENTANRGLRPCPRCCVLLEYGSWKLRRCRPFQACGFSGRFAKKTRGDSMDHLPPTDSPPMSVAYLEKLNPEQRRAVEHGVRENDAALGAPLLVIAGAGSGKTNTLAHRVAHLIVNGADPRKILLMTFSRRAASEMTRRVERIARQVMGDRAGVMTDALTWAGTFHGIGARLLRDHASEIGLDPSFTIHDREDSADLMNLVRHELGLSKTKSRFPMKGTCLSIYSRCVNAELAIEEVLGTSFPWCAAWTAA